MTGAQQLTARHQRAQSVERASVFKATWFYFLPVVLVFALMTGAAMFVPLSTAIELGRDEGFELAKAFLYHQGIPLYSRVWNDQPPLFTGLLHWVFLVTGPSLLAARLLVLGFGLLLLGSLAGAVARRSGRVSAVAATLLLAASPFFLSLSVSVMQEIPAFGLGMASLLVLMIGGGSRRLAVWAGLLLGCALMVKFTAALLIPAMLMLMALQGSEWKSRFKTAAALSTAALAACMVAGAWFGFGGFSMLAQPHIQPQSLPGISKASDYRFPFKIVAEHWEGYACVLGALVAAWKRRLWRELAVPLTLLVTVTLVHLLHRPWWYCYYLHHAIPIAWIGGVLMRELGRAPVAALKAASLNPKALAAVAALAMVGCVSLLRVEHEFRRILTSARIQDSAVLARIDALQKETQWFYAQPVIYSFHARLPVPPELAVVTLKRYWSGQMTWQELFRTVSAYRPEQMLLFKATMGPEWKELLATQYRLDWEDAEMALYVQKSLVATPLPEGAQVSRGPD